MPVEEVPVSSMCLYTWSVILISPEWVKNGRGLCLQAYPIGCPNPRRAGIIRR